MNLIDHYIELRHLHIACVAASGLLFAARSLAVLAGAAWPLRRTARVASWLIDSVLLTAGVLLWTALRIDPLHQPWLAAKLVLLVVYVGLGTMALRRARTAASRAGWTLAAWACFGWMVSIALTRHPLGVLTLLH